MSTSLRTARITGLLYLALGVSGMLGFLLIRSRLFDPEAPAATLRNLVEQESLARAGVALELMVVLAQALTAVWFFRLFRDVDRLAAAGIAVFGTVNAVAVLGSAAALHTALRIAVDPVGDAAATVHVLYLLSDGMWTGGSLFFGLWLVPMGLCVLRAPRMPRALGLVLVAGGAGYVLQAFVVVLAPGAGTVAGLLVVPATVGEFWMIGRLLIRGIGKTRFTPDAAPRPAAAPA